MAPTLGGSAALAWIHGPLDGEWQVEVRGEPFPCRVSLAQIEENSGCVELSEYYGQYHSDK